MQTVLILEDEPAVMRLLRLMLKRYDVMEAFSAEHALRLFTGRDREILLLLADVSLPISSGIRVALALRGAIPNLPVILTSGWSRGDWSERDSQDLETLGAESVTVLQKPFLAEALLRAVRDLIGGPQVEAAGAGRA